VRDGFIPDLNFKKPSLVIPAARFRPSGASRWPSPEKRAQGKPGADRTRSLVCESEKHTSVVTTGSAERSRLSPRNGFTVYFVLSPVSGLFCHRRRRDTSLQLDARVAAPGPHDFAVRLPSVFVRASSSRADAASVHRNPCPTFRDDREAPLMRARDAGGIFRFAETVKR
jgi:hypothetical protein